MMESDNTNESRGDSKIDRSLVYMGVILGVIILVMGYLTLFVDDPWKIFRKNPEQTELSADKSQLLNKTEVMNDEEVRQSLVKFIEAFYFDQKRGYFDPPSYFAPITETFYNYHKLTYSRLKQVYWSRKQDMENLNRSWIVSSLDFKRANGHIIATYWTSESYYRPSQNMQQSADVKYELITDENGKIISLKELEVKNFVSYHTGSENLAVDSGIVDNSASAEVSQTGSEDMAAAASEDVSDQKVYELGAADTPPEFPGGQKELSRFISRHMRYPVQARNNDLEGRVFTGFIVERNGTLSDFKVLRGIGSGCDEEALRVIRMLPSWKPATIAGKTVRNSYVLSVTFKLEK